MSAYVIRASLLCSDWLLQLVSIGYGRAHQSEFLLIVSREVKGEESALPNNSGEVCLTNFCPRAGHCMVPMFYPYTPRWPLFFVPSRHTAAGHFLSWFFSVFICTACSPPVRLREQNTFFSCVLLYFVLLLFFKFFLFILHSQFVSLSTAFCVFCLDVAIWLFWGALL